MLVALMLGLLQSQPSQDATQPPASPAPRPILEELAERSLKFTNFRASFRKTITGEAAAAWVNIDYRAPDAMRFEIQGTNFDMTEWHSGSVLVMRMHEGEHRGYARIDLREQLGSWATVQAALRQAFPAAPKLDLDVGKAHAIHMSWSLDSAAQEANFSIAPLALTESDTPFGWLTTLRGKHAEPTLDGEVLRFTSDDGHFDIALAKSTGFLQKFVGRSPKKATLTLDLEAVVFDQPVEPGRLDLPTDAPQGDDLTERVRASSGALLREVLRSHVWGALTTASETSNWDDDLKTRIQSVLRPLEELEQDAWLGAWLVQTQAWIDDSAKWLADQRAHVKSDAEYEQLARTRLDKMNALLKQLDEMAAKRRDSLEVPKEYANAAHIDGILELERSVADSVLQQRFRAPLAERFKLSNGALK